MTRTSFSEQVFRFLLFSPESLTYFKLLKKEYFPELRHQELFSALQQYYDEYKTLPYQYSSLHEYLKTGLSNSQEDQKFLADFEKTCQPIYDSEKHDVPPVQKSIADFARKEQVKSVAIQLGTMLEGTRELDLDSIMEGIKSAQYLTEFKGMLEGTNLKNFLVKGIPQMDTDLGLVRPSAYKGLNNFREFGGNHVGEHYILLSGTKSYKTTICLNLAVGYLKQGLNVYYVDTENTVSAILTRARQRLSNTSARELFSPEGRQLLQREADKLQGDMYADFYMSGAMIEEVDAKLEILMRAYNWKPDVIIWDDMDHFDYQGSARNKTTAWKHSAQLIAKATNINMKYQTISWAVAQITKEANKRKDSFTIADIGESFSKVKQASGVIGLFQSEEEKAQNLLKVELLVQRRGKPREHLKPFYLKIEGETQTITEVEDDFALPNLPASEPAKGRRK